MTYVHYDAAGADACDDELGRVDAEGGGHLLDKRLAIKLIHGTIQRHGDLSRRCARGRQLRSRYNI